MKKSSVLLSVLLGCTLLLSSACGEEAKEEEYSVYAPDGAPALALCKGIAEADADEWNFSYRVVDASTIQTYVTGEEQKADFCILPLNLASKLLGTGEVYQMLGTVTNGNMYFLTKAGESLSLENLSSLVGKTVGVVQLPNVPGLTLRAVLDTNDVPYSMLGNDVQARPDAVNLKAVSPTDVTPAGGCDYYLCPEPAASTKVEKTNGALKFAGDLQEMYGEGGYPQAVLVAKTSVIEEAESAVEQLISYVEGAETLLAQTDGAEISSLLDGVRTEGLSPSFTAENLTSAVIANSSVHFTAATEAKGAVNAFLTALITVNSDSATAVSEGFFYGG